MPPKKPAPARPGRPRKAAFKPVREIAPVYGGMESVLSRLEALVQTLGNNKLAGIMDVSASQPSRWRSGKEVPSDESQRKIIMLDHVLARLFREMMPEAGLIWLESYNDILATRPVDALWWGKFDKVLGAIEIEENGGIW